MGQHFWPPRSELPVPPGQLLLICGLHLLASFTGCFAAQGGSGWACMGPALQITICWDAPGPWIALPVLPHWQAFLAWLLQLLHAAHFLPHLTCLVPCADVSMGNVLVASAMAHSLAPVVGEWAASLSGIPVPSISFSSGPSSFSLQSNHHFTYDQCNASWPDYSPATWVWANPGHLSGRGTCTSLPCQSHIDHLLSGKSTAWVGACHTNICRCWFRLILYCILSTNGSGLKSLWQTPLLLVSYFWSLMYNKSGF